MKCRSLFICWGVACWFASLNSVLAQGTAFTYQGELYLNAAPANGNYDMQFKLRPQATGTNQVGSTLTNAPTGVTNGLFTVALDFGDVFTTNPLYLEIGLRTNGSTSAYTILAPTQLITSAPYAVQALSATSLTGIISDAQLPTNVPTLNSNSVFTARATFSNATGFFNGALSGTFSGIGAGTFSGNGANLTNLNVTNLVGVVQSNPNWQLVQAASQQAVVANNYLTTNAAQTTLILPASPSVGSTLRFAGSGGNGWVITQNSGQSILTAPLGLPAGQIWAQRGNSFSWQALASSTNGVRLAAAYGGGLGFIYYSADGGITWSKSDAPNLNWTGVAASADGTHMVAVQNGGQIYTSANGGTNWIKQLSSPSANFTCVASSADGINLVAAPGSTGVAIYTSSDGGQTWTARITGQDWTAVASSADGTKLAAAASGVSQIYVSSDEGATWAPHGPSASWTGLASSADGTKLAATTKSPGNIYTSGDSGLTWIARSTNAAWSCVTSSASGQSLAAAYNTGFIYTSTDAGQTWTQRTNGISTIAQSWTALTSSGDGARLVAAANTGFLYVTIAATTTGTNGSLSGAQYSNIELQYIGNGQWMPLSAYGTFSGN